MEGPNGDFVVGMSNEDNQTLKRFPPLDPLSLFKKGHEKTDGAEADSQNSLPA